VLTLQLLFLVMVAWVVYYGVTTWLELSRQPRILVRLARGDHRWCLRLLTVERMVDRFTLMQIRFWFMIIPTALVIVSQIVGMFSMALIVVRPNGAFLLCAPPSFRPSG